MRSQPLRFALPTRSQHKLWRVLRTAPLNTRRRQTATLLPPAFRLPPQKKSARLRQRNHTAHSVTADRRKTAPTRAKGGLCGTHLRSADGTSDRVFADGQRCSLFASVAHTCAPDGGRLRRPLLQPCTHNSTLYLIASPYAAGATHDGSPRLPGVQARQLNITRGCAVPGFAVCHGGCPGPPGPQSSRQSAQASLPPAAELRRFADRRGKNPKMLRRKPASRHGNETFQLDQ